MIPLDAEGEFDSLGALYRDGHYVYTSGGHGSTYFNKDMVLAHAVLVSRLCRQMALVFAMDAVEIVVAPAVGGIALAQNVARHLSRVGGNEILAVYAEKVQPIPRLLLIISGRQIFALGTPRDDRFIVRRGYEKMIPGKNVLIVEDVTHTGGTAFCIREAVENLGGRVVGAACVCDLGNVTADRLGVPKFLPVFLWPQTSFLADECPLCQKGIPINIEVGHGAQFVKSR